MIYKLTLYKLDKRRNRTKDKEISLFFSDYTTGFTSACNYAERLIRQSRFNDYQGFNLDEFVPGCGDYQNGRNYEPVYAGTIW